MKRLATTLAASLAALAVSAGSAFAAGSPVQSATQSSGTDQGAIAASSATQVDPSNQNISVRVLSPGSDGNVTQSNNATSTATAANTAGTTQTATQLQGGGCGCQLTPVQQILQDTANGQLGGVLSAAQQLGASNATAPSSVASPSGGEDPTSQPSTAAPSTAAPAAPSTTQSNGATSTGSATNTAPTGQTASQTQGGSGVQSADQQAQTDQAALAGSSAQQVDPSNSNISVRVLSPGSDGNVTQSNNATSTANASNTGSTTQSGTQIQSGSGSGVQSATQNAETQQLAGAASSAEADRPVELEHLRSRAQPRLRRQRDAVEHRHVDRDGDEQRAGHPDGVPGSVRPVLRVRRSGSGRAVDHAGKLDRPDRRRAVVGRAGRRLQLERPGPGRKRRWRRQRDAVKHQRPRPRLRRTPPRCRRTARRRSRILRLFRVDAAPAAAIRPCRRSDSRAGSARAPRRSRVPIRSAPPTRTTRSGSGVTAAAAT